MASWSFLNPPSQIIASEGKIAFTTHPQTDYWHPPDGIAANGHFYYTKARLPYLWGLHVQCTVHGDYKVTYDQAGIMMRANAERWIKAGVEYVDGISYLRFINPISKDVADGIVRL
jgi:regulation of enolase protein 1 (concanavalin A-like superfamily)